MRSVRRALIFPAAVILGLAAGIVLRPYLRPLPPVAKLFEGTPQPSGTTTAAAPATITPAAIASDATALPAASSRHDGLALSLRRDGKMLRVSWDRAAPILREATLAQLYIV